MAAPNDSNVRIISGEQAQALTEAIVACEADHDDDHAVDQLVAGISSILGVAAIVFCRGADSWSAVSPRAPHSLSASLAPSLDRALASAEAAVSRRIGGEDWTILRGSDQAPHVALTVQGDWTRSANLLIRIARLIQLKLDRAGERAS
jgi:hypothetical protein